MMADSRFLETLEKGVLLGDGAYGTEFLRRGCLRERPFDEMNLTRPGMVLDLHREYVLAGAELLKTNTFLANRGRLDKHGLGDKTREINLAGARLARDAAQGRFVAGSIGPQSDLPADGRAAAYAEQCGALAEGGCDVLMLETFTDPDDLGMAIVAACQTGLPIVSEMTVSSGTPLAFFKTYLRVGQVVGVNCVTPMHALRAMEYLQTLSALPRSAFPSAGPPGQEAPPETFAAWIKDLVEAGASLVGGCCGAGPEHIRAAAAAVGRGR
jgi:homocysteine S-methyltransferase